MSRYTTMWARLPAFDDDGTRSRTSATLTEARLIMQMAYMIEPEFHAIGIIDEDGRVQSFDLADPRVSEQEYINHGFDDYDSWVIRGTNEPAEAARRDDRDQTGSMAGVAAPLATNGSTAPTAVVPRLQLKLIMGEAVLGGTWWPWSRDLGQELLSLADHWPVEFGRIVGVLYSAADWNVVPRRIASRDLTISASSFPYENPHKIILTLAGSHRRVELQLVPADADATDPQSSFETPASLDDRRAAKRGARSGLAAQH